MRTFFCAVLLSLVVGVGYGQQSTGGVVGYNQFHTAPKGFLTTIAPAPREKSFSIYLHDDWRNGDVFFKDSTKLGNLNIKVDLKGSMLEIQFNNDIKILPFSRVLAVVLRTGIDTQDVYVNGAVVFSAASPLKDQLVQVLSEDEVSLYGKFISQIIEAKPNPALALNSSIEDKVIVKKKYLITYKGETIEVESKHDLKEDVVEVFGANATSFLKNVSPRDEGDLVLLVKKLNGLAKAQ
jgi:hypothetical protein